MITYAEAYSTLLTYAQNNNYTPAQARAATKIEIATILGVSENDPEWSNNNIGYFINVRENVARALQKEINQTDFEIFRNAVLAVFPNATFYPNKRHRSCLICIDGEN